MKTLGRGRGRWRAAVLAVLLLGAGCGDDDGPDGAEDAGPDDGALSVTLTEDGVEGFPEEVGAAAVEIEVTNRSGAPASLELTKAESGATAREVSDALATAQEGTSIPETIKSFVGSPPIGRDATATVTVTLTEGTWFANVVVEPQSDDGEPKLGTPVELAVTEGIAGVRLPEAGSTVTARDYSFEVDITAGSTDLSYFNEGPDELHHAVFFPMAEGVDEEAARAAVEAFLKSEDERPPPPEFDFEGPSGNDTNVAGPGHGVVQPQGDFEAGRTYAVICFIQDRAGSPPHAVAYDMYDVFTVAE